MANRTLIGLNVRDYCESDYGVPMEAEVGLRDV